MAVRAGTRLARTARRGVDVLGGGTPAATRLENIARFLGFVGESTTRTAEQARDLLRTGPETPRATPRNRAGTAVRSQVGAVDLGGADARPFLRRSWRRGGIEPL
ncbi:hypothetical protein GCM10009605_34310 [Nocardiopsis composta]